MPLASYVLSLCLHIGISLDSKTKSEKAFDIGIILIIWLWPASKPLVYPEQPVMISLVDGAPGGNKEPSPILGPMGAKADGESAPAPAAKKAEVAQQEREETRAAPIKAPKDERPMKKEEPKKPELKPAPKQEVQPKEKAISPKKKDIKEEPKKKDEEKPKPQAKPQEQKQDQKQKTSGKDTKDSENKGAEDKDAIASALNQARRKATSRTGSDSGGGSSVEQALAQARKNAGGNRGGGGGEGSGPGGGGLHSVYLGQVMLAVRPNWGYASGSRANLQCTVHITVTAAGQVQTAQIVASSGNAQYDASCVNAIWRTSKAGDFPPPPTPMYHELDIVFTLNEMRGR